MTHQIDYRKTSPQKYYDLAGEHTAVYAGHCIVCHRTVYAANDGRGDYDPDPRGVINALHARSQLIASEYDMTGPDFNLCFDCANTEPLYRAGLAHARQHWQDAPEEATQ